MMIKGIPKPTVVMRPFVSFFDTQLFLLRKHHLTTFLHFIVLRSGTDISQDFLG